MKPSSIALGAVALGGIGYFVFKPKAAKAATPSATPSTPERLGTTVLVDPASVVYVESVDDVPEGEDYFFAEEEIAKAAVASSGSLIAGYDQTPWDSRDDLALAVRENLMNTFPGGEDYKLIASFQYSVGGIKVDGKYGNQTREALAVYLPPGLSVPAARY